MNWRVSVRIGATIDLREAQQWYENARAGLGEEFLLEAAQSLLRLEESAGQFPIYYKRFRRLLMSRFPYRIFFQIDGEEVIVFRILHAAREHGTQLK